MNWQTIETAPRDGTEILGARKIEGVWFYGVMHWNDAIWSDFFEEFGTEKATHWAPITPPEPARDIDRASAP